MIQGEQLYHFHLSRVMENNKGEWIQSTLTVEVMTEDPFRTKEVVLKNFPGWAFMTFDSPIDREFREEFDGRR
jgi:hypothetical protein